MAVLTAVIVGLASYLIGSLNFSIILSKLVSGDDIRESGSGNAGATNMLRTHGKKLAVLTLVLDILKGVVCVAAAVPLGEKLGIGCLPYIAGLCVVLGHNFPLYFGFRGGKGVATSLGVVLMLDWKVGLAVAVVSILIMAAFRYVSLGSILGGAAFVIAEWIKMFVTDAVDWVGLTCVTVMGALLIIRHHANIKRLLSGTENKLGNK